jgi:hypothetical protein
MRGRTKYNARRTQIDGLWFASQMEARRYQSLKLLQFSGEISDLKLQPRFPLVVNGARICTYVADFGYIEHGLEVVEDVKGVLNPVFKLKQKLLRALYGIEIRLTRA